MAPLPCRSDSFTRPIRSGKISGPQTRLDGNRNPSVGPRYRLNPHARPVSSDIRYLALFGRRTRHQARRRPDDHRGRQRDHYRHSGDGSRGHLSRLVRQRSAAASPSLVPTRDLFGHRAFSTGFVAVLWIGELLPIPACSKKGAARWVADCTVDRVRDRFGWEARARRKDL
jgi:hypothetical protein